LDFNADFSTFLYQIHNDILLQGGGEREREREWDLKLKKKEGESEEA